MKCSNCGKRIWFFMSKITIHWDGINCGGSEAFCDDVCKAQWLVEKGLLKGKIKCNLIGGSS